VSEDERLSVPVPRIVPVVASSGRRAASSGEPRIPGVTARPAGSGEAPRSGAEPERWSRSGARGWGIRCRAAAAGTDTSSIPCLVAPGLRPVPRSAAFCTGALLNYSILGEGSDFIRKYARCLIMVAAHAARRHSKWNGTTSGGSAVTPPWFISPYASETLTCRTYHS
jgi:hypothetical protein